MTDPEDIKRSTAQDLFNNAVNRIRSQGGQAHHDFGCAYRTWGGRACAVGASLSDEEAASDAWNDNDTLSDVLEYLETVGEREPYEWAFEHEGFLEALQVFHDMLRYRTGTEEGEVRSRHSSPSVLPDEVYLEEFNRMPPGFAKACHARGLVSSPLEIPPAG